MSVGVGQPLCLYRSIHLKNCLVFGVIEKSECFYSKVVKAKVIDAIVITVGGISEVFFGKGIVQPKSRESRVYL